MFPQFTLLCILKVKESLDLALCFSVEREEAVEKM